ncbi:MAG TPA: hypothetical protein PKO10_01090, partial [Aliarcobacter cryaerophilus]|nr:hypothetical protein [Aliarcobacter cryaerophilus]
CKKCGQYGGKLHAHHKKPFSIILKQNNITTIKEALNCKELWKKSNGVTLCIKCHKKTDSYLWKNNVNS